MNPLHTQPPSAVLLDDFVCVRPWRPDDAEALHRVAEESLRTVSPWISWLDPIRSLADSQRWIADSGELWSAASQYRFGIFDAEDPHHLLGGIGLNHLNPTHRIANLGYWVRTSTVGRGIATRASLLVARFGLTELGLGRIEIITATDNAASHRVAEKVGAVFEGVQRNRLRMHGAWIPARMYSLVPEDLR
ncbi:MAG: GNAT family N-acetyltransferase [Planctomycetes bacterium]|jgi:RimJ/RimL family protein N-acetyltransferase|nr:GNAT family N-acetyltransferase [Planctomycetota bacterium]